MNFDNLSPETKERIKGAFSPELIARAKAAQSMEELLDIAQEEGVELSDEQMELVAGGCYGQRYACDPNCQHSC